MAAARGAYETSHLVLFTSLIGFKWHGLCERARSFWPSTDRLCSRVPPHPHFTGRDSPISDAL